jgi:hypothetical protein
VRAALVLALVVLGGCTSSTAPGGSTSTSDGGGPLPPSTWQVVFDGAPLDRAVLGVWGAGPNDVFAVGGPLGNAGLESLALHFDGTGWRELSPGGSETLWWVNGSGPDDVWMVGEKGRIVHWDGARFVEHASGVTATIWGAWTFSPADAWAVGGTPEGGTKAPNDLVLHWDGKAWSREALPGAPLGRAHYKVWGTSSSDLYVVGEAGTIWHRKGTSWTLESKQHPLAKGTLFTVYGCSAHEVYAVGGDDVLRSDGATWSRVDVALTNQVDGVSCGGPGEAVIVGLGGLKQRLVQGTWVDDFRHEPFGDLHSCWADRAGSFWAVGGDFFSKPEPGKPREGIVARFGPGTVPTALAK